MDQKMNGLMAMVVLMVPGVLMAQTPEQTTEEPPVEISEEVVEGEALPVETAPAPVEEAPIEAAPAPVDDEDADVQHQVSITISPIHLVQPIVELTGEYCLADKIGAALILGGGSVSSDNSNYTAIEAGAQFRYYVLGTFIHGLQVGAEVLYLYLSNSGDSAIEASGDGLAVGPFLGYKIATNLGFTFEMQGGVQYLFASAKAESGSVSATAEDSNIIPLVNINLGWSF